MVSVLIIQIDFLFPFIILFVPDEFSQKQNIAYCFKQKIWFKHFSFALSQQWLNPPNTGGITYGADALQT